MRNASKGELKMTAGLDLGDRYSHLCLIPLPLLDRGTTTRGVK